MHVWSQTSKSLETSGHYRRPETEQVCRWRKELPAYIFAVRATEASRALTSFRTRPGDRPATPTWTSRLPTWAINNRPGHAPDWWYRDWFRAQPKVSVALVDLTATYDTVWLRGLHLKLLCMLPDRHMVSFVMELLTNRSFTLRTSDGQVSRLRRIHNGVPQGSTLAPTLFNIYISDIPKTTSKQYGYADDLALLAAHQTWEKVEETLNQDIQSLSEYLSCWRLKLSTAKTTTTAFHLNSRDTHRQLDVVVNSAPLPNTNNPVYLVWLADVQKNTSKAFLSECQERSPPLSGWLQLGSVHVDAADRRASPCVQRRWVCITSLVPQYPH